MLTHISQQSLCESKRSLKFFFVLVYLSMIFSMMIFPDASYAEQAGHSYQMNLIREYVYPLEKGIQLQLVYRSNVLCRIRLSNEGEPVILSMFAQHYTLGHNETLSIKSPPVKQFAIHLQPYALGLVDSSVLASAKERVFHVRLHNAFFRLKDTV